MGYVGKLVKYNGAFLYPKDPLLASKVDEVLDAFDDLWILLAPTFRMEDKDQKVKERQRLFSSDGEASAKVAIFESILACSNNGYVVQDAGLTIADLAYFGGLNLIRSGFVEGLDRSIFADYKHIMKHKEK